MELREILCGGGGALLIILTLIEVLPVKLDPWKAIAKWVGRAINGEIFEKIEKLESDIKKMQDGEDERDIRNARTRILRFGDEVRRGELHSQEHFDDVMDDISEYKTYCAEHPEFKNEKLGRNAQLISDTYYRCLEENSFI